MRLSSTTGETTPHIRDPERTWGQSFPITATAIWTGLISGATSSMLSSTYRLITAIKSWRVASNVVLTDTDGNNTVPFYFMPDLGGRQRLRGFRERRFRDRNSIFASAEYRWEAWWALDVAVFGDAGKVAARRSDINLKDLEGTYGIGFRLHSKKAFAFRLDLAHSREGFMPIFSAHHVF